MVKPSSRKPRSSSSKSKKRPNINQVRTKIRAIATEHGYNEEILLSFAEYLNGGPYKAVELSMADLKAEVIKTFGCSSYAELKKNGNFQMFVSDNKLKMNSKAAWLKVYRKFVGLPSSEKDAIGATSINGVDVMRNFLPWKVFNLDPKQASASDVKQAFNQLAKTHHPDYGGNPEVFEKLKNMRDSLLAAY